MKYIYGRYRERTQKMRYPRHVVSRLLGEKPRLEKCFFVKCIDFVHSLIFDFPLNWGSIVCAPTPIPSFIVI